MRIRPIRTPDIRPCVVWRGPRGGVLLPKVLACTRVPCFLDNNIKNYKILAANRANLPGLMHYQKENRALKHRPHKDLEKN